MTNKKKLIHVATQLFVACTVIVCVLQLSSRCGKSAGDEASQPIDTARIVATLRLQSKLYTAETTAHKTMKYSSDRKLGVRLLGKDRDISLPLTHSEASIPVSVTYKAGIDMTQLADDDILISQKDSAGTVRRAIAVRLPLPEIELTAVSIDHKSEHHDRQMFGKDMDDATYQRLVDTAKKNIWNEMTPQDIADINETARVSASDILIPVLRDLGFTDIFITYKERPADLNATKEQKLEKLKN